MAVSGNYFRKGWSRHTKRRLKNVIVVMEYIPDRDMMAEADAQVIRATATHTPVLCEPYLMFLVRVVDGPIAVSG